MRPLSTFLHRRVVTESGEVLGRAFDLRASLTSRSLTVDAIVLGKRGMLEHFGVVFLRGGRRRAGVRGHDTVPWTAVVRLEHGRVVVRDGTTVS